MRKPVQSLLSFIGGSLLIVYAIGAALPGTKYSSASASDASQPSLVTDGLSYSVEYNTITWTGRVKNAWNQRLEYVKAHLECVTATGEFVTSDYTYLDFTTLLPGQTSPFTGYANWNPAIKSCSIRFSRGFGNELIATTTADKASADTAKGEAGKRVDDNTPEWKAAMQRFLTSEGLHPGPADGIVGAKTYTAMMAWCGTEDVIACEPELIQAVDDYIAGN